MALEKTWRWFGERDIVTLADLRQMGVEGVVTSLHNVPQGSIWPVEDILHVKSLIESFGLHWSVVESLPVPEGIKIASKERPILLNNYQQSLMNLAACGIDTVCYNFMPVLDWARTDLHYRLPSGGEGMMFDLPTFAAFDIFVLRRPHAADDYSELVLHRAEEINRNMSEEQKETLAHNIIVVTQAFIDGVVDTKCKDYKQSFLRYLSTYEKIGQDELRANLSFFLKAVAPVAEQCGISLCIHPDDPPFPLLGLPRIASTLDDLLWITKQYDSPSNGITFCTGSLSGRKDNDLVAMAEKLASRISYVHLRNTAWTPAGQFYESGHLTGSVDMFSIVKIMLEEQRRRRASGRKDSRMPFRPDHGIKILDDFSREANPGYPLIGRLKGLAEIDGLQTAIERIFLSDEKAMI